MELLEIAKLPTAENSAIHLHPADNVAVARVPIAAGSELRIDGIAVTVRDAIPAGHKVAIAAIAPGEIVHRYGQAIGRARQAIEAGRHVHTQNLAYEELTLDYEFPTGDIPFPKPPKNVPTFLAVVRHQNDQRLIVNSQSFQLRRDPPHIVINELHFAFVELPDP